MFDKKDVYSVENAYHVCVDVLINRDEWKLGGDWNKFWSLPIHLKVKHFMWHIEGIVYRIDKTEL